MNKLQSLQKVEDCGFFVYQRVSCPKTTTVSVRSSNG